MGGSTSSVWKDRKKEMKKYRKEQRKEERRKERKKEGIVGQEKGEKSSITATWVPPELYG